MKNETDTEEKKTTPPAPKEPEKTYVTSTQTIDWPQYGWAIRAGETRELPVDADAQAAILGSQHITKVKN